ncbi:MAG: hypothetical protein QG597_859 [Actinomycetota bacterium]|nr:hypothetical protein [Actinomycetota bacterium]
MVAIWSSARLWPYAVVALLLAIIGAVMIAATPARAAAVPAEQAAPEAGGSAPIVPMAATTPTFTSIPSVRVADTRPNQPTAFPAIEVAVPADGTLEVPAAGANGIPGNAVAVVANITAAAPTGTGHLRVFPCGQARPTVSTLNYPRGVSVANASVVATGTGGRICVYTPTQTHVMVDINGYFPAGSSYAPITPVRVADTRPDKPVLFPPMKEPLRAGQGLVVPAAGTNGIPADATAIIANITATAPSGSGHLRVYPCGPALPPSASTLNYPAGASVANLVIVAPGQGGQICIFTPTETHVLVDISGYIPAGTSYTPIAPVRVADTRSGQPVAFPSTKAAIPAGGTLEVPVAGGRDVPIDPAAVVANITATGPTGGGHLRVYPCGQGLPNASTLNYRAGASVANAAIVAPGTAGRICVYSVAETHVIVDITGYFPASGSDRIGAGAAHTCAIVYGGLVKCWGANSVGQLGDGTTTRRTAPVTVAGIRGAVALSAGGYHTCAVVAGGQVKCWGFNGSGQLGDGSFTNRISPVTVAGLSGVTAMAAGGDHTCAVVAGGQVKCWGQNGLGQIGDGTFGISRTTPVNVVGLVGATSVTGGASHSCAVAGGQAWCWGANDYGQLGDGSTWGRSTPAVVPGLSGVAAVAAGGLHTCAIVRNLASSSTRCWGNNDYGQLGDGTTTGRLSPVAAIEVSGAALLDAGIGHTCAVRRGFVIGDHLKCWGSGYYGELGNGSRSNQAVPQMVIGIGINGADSLTAGDGHTCAVAPGSVIKCWGSNADGQVGDRSYAVVEYPLEVAGLREP